MTFKSSFQPLLHFPQPIGQHPPVSTGIHLASYSLGQVGLHLHSKHSSWRSLERLTTQFSDHKTLQLKCLSQKPLTRLLSFSSPLETVFEQNHPPFRASLVTHSVKNPPSMQETTCNAGDPNLMLGLGRSPGGGRGNPLQYSCLENSMDIGAWQATIHGVTKDLDTTW